ncbi:MAG: AgmX/PglI C-terminal domain-containing protein [Myxococcales bacterium]|nr:AgmX/PglI C-terminal domain-containing protein [Myxococcales bacterium]
MAQQQSGGRRPGAMTQAMAAAKNYTGPKVLRVGVFRGTKVTEERIIRERVTVTVGTTERNTFTVVAPEVPPSFELFSMEGGQYVLNFTDRMEGRVVLDSGIKKLSELRQGGAQRGPAGFKIPLPESSRGKIELGEVTFLFQFVVPPPPQPKPQLPAAIRSNVLRNVDWTYNACLSFFLVVAIVGVAYVEYIYDPVVDDGLDLSDARLVRLLATPAAPEEPPPPEQTPDQNQQPEQNQAAAAPAQHAPSPAQNAAARQAAAQGRAERQASNAAAAAERAANAALAGLQNSAEFAALTGATDTGRGSARDALSQGGLMAGSERDLANVGGISTATGSGVRRGGLAASAGGNGLGGRGLGQSGTVNGGGGNIGSGGEVVTERVIRGSANVGGGDSVGGEGNVDANAVARIIRGQLGGIRSCYERSLRNNPTLSGRLDVRFTIGESGRISSINSSGLPAAPEVGTCVEGRIRNLVFPRPEGGSVEFSFPFTFTPGS